jgi:phosphopantothenoylcysteine decarboxylase
MKVLLGVTGSVSSKITDKLVSELEKDGHQVKVVLTWSTIYFWEKGFWLYLLSFLYSKLLPKAWTNPMTLKHYTDFHEWRGYRYHKNDPVLHIALRDWADVFLIAPLTANTLAKTANGICDNLLTSIVRAWFVNKPMIIAPAMNTFMWSHPLTKDHLTQLAKFYNLSIVFPVSKRLACGDIGVGALAEIKDIVGRVRCLANIQQD